MDGRADMDGGDMFDGRWPAGRDGDIGGDDPAALPEMNGGRHERSIELPFLLVLAVAVAGLIAALILYVEPR
jgi:hypothetical protein